jgi:uncharacterized protein (DUF1697 family)
MALVVFMRVVNVGGHNSFQPAVLARAMAALDVVNIGAAGTFVVRGKVAQAWLRAEFRRRLAFDAEMMICPGRELLELTERDPFSESSPSKETRGYVSIMDKRPRALPKLPVSRPDGNDWQVKVCDVLGRFAVSLHRRLGRTLVYPNEVVEKHFGVPATTRNWDTITAICELLKAGKSRSS